MAACAAFSSSGPRVLQSEREHGQPDPRPFKPTSQSVNTHRNPALAAVSCDGLPMLYTPPLATTTSSLHGHPRQCYRTAVVTPVIHIMATCCMQMWIWPPAMSRNGVHYGLWVMPRQSRGMRLVAAYRATPAVARLAVLKIIDF